MPTSIFFANRQIFRSGVYSQVDASGLEVQGLGSSGILAILATGEGGRPVSSITNPEDIPRLNTPEQVRQIFRSGNMREAAAMAFQPSNDPQIPGGAQQVVALKINPATQSSASLANSAGNVIDLTSEDYGAFTDQISVSIGAGTVQGKLITILFETTTESFDNVGGANLATLEYVDGATTYDTATASVSSAGVITVAATRAETGLDGDSATPITAAQAVEVVATAADAGKTIRIYGQDASSAPQTEVITLVNGTATGTLTWDLVTGAVLSAAAAGTVDVRDANTNVNIFTQFAATQRSKGAQLCEGMFVTPGTASALVLDAAGAHLVQIWGINSAGAIISQELTTNGATSVPFTVTTFARIDAITLVAVPAARTLTLSATAATTDIAVQSTVQKAKDFFNARLQNALGFNWVNVTGQTQTALTQLDETTAAIDIVTNPGGLTADTYAVINKINASSQLVTAALSTGAQKTAPDNTTSPVFLSGGGEGTPTFSNWQAALNLLKQIRVNTIVPLTGDPAVHAAGDAHCAYMGGIGRSERDMVVGLSALDVSDVPTDANPTLTSALAQVVNLNSRHVRAVAQSVVRFNTQGVRTTFLPYYSAVLAAGMQAGSPVGTALTHKYLDALDFTQDSSWNPVDDAEQAIAGGLMFMENKPGIGRRWVRNVTTYLQTVNIAYSEASVNEAVNFAVFTLRNALEFAIGRPNFAGTLQAIRSVATNILGLLVDEGVLVSFQGLSIVSNGDRVEISVQLAPTISINFIETTVHLQTTSLAA